MKNKIPSWLKLIKENCACVDLRMPIDSVKRGEIKAANLQINPETVDDIIPKPDDWLMAKFRAISAAYLGEEGYYLDFSKPGILLQSIPLMLTKNAGGTRRRPLKFHRNHSDLTQNIIGYISAASWSEAGGDQTYPGINIDVMIDYKLAPNEARQIMAEPPLVESCSISFYFEWEQSHPDLETWQFWNLIGEEIDGQIVRIMVTEILEYRHVALVHEGADEEADKLYEAESGEQTAKNQKQNLGGNKMMKFLLSDEQIQAITGILGLEKIESPEQLVTEVSNLVKDIDKLHEEKKSLVSQAEKFAKLLNEKRDAVKSLVVKVDGENTKGTQAVVDRLEWDELTNLEKEYAAKLEAKHPLKCMDCGGMNCERRSSIEQPPKSNNGATERPVDASNFKIR